MKSRHPELIRNVARILVVLSAVAFTQLSISGCASNAENPTSSAYASAPEKPRRTSCPAGYVLACDVGIGGKISDGRKDFRTGREQRCGCQIEGNFGL